MSFRLGLVGLCTSHPESWVPVIRELAPHIEISAAWDSGETRPANFAETFCRTHHIPRALDNLADMLPLVDGVIVHTTNWDRHLEQAKPFVEAGKSVFIDKPVVGNMEDAARFLDWIKEGRRVTGGSALRFCKEAAELLAKPESERGRIYTAYTSVGTDEFNYGIHGYAMLSSLMGPGIQSVRYLGCSNQKQIQIDWRDGRIGLLSVGKSAWFPFHFTATTDIRAYQCPVDGREIYRSLLKKVLPYLSGQTDEAPLAPAEILEPEFAAMAARQSWRHGGERVFLNDLAKTSDGYDGNQFASEYRRSRLEAK